MLAWLRSAVARREVVMSVCTGAFVLADAGLLDGKTATTHHDSYDRLHLRFPSVTVSEVCAGCKVLRSSSLREVSARGLIWPSISSSFTSGAIWPKTTADMMEYEGQGWKGGGKATIAFASPAAPTYASDANTEGAFGRWQGVIKTPDDAYQIVVHLWKKADGSVGGALDSVDQQTYGLAINEVAVRGSSISFAVPSVMASYHGILSASGMEGAWQQNGESFKLSLQRVRAAPIPTVSSDDAFAGHLEMRLSLSRFNTTADFGNAILHTG